VSLFSAETLRSGQNVKNFDHFEELWKPVTNLVSLFYWLNTQLVYLIHRKKKVREFPVPSRDVTTKLSLGGNNDVVTELFLPRGSLVSDIPAGDGKLVNLFLRYRFARVYSSIYHRCADLCFPVALIKNKIRFSSYIRKFRREKLHRKKRFTSFPSPAGMSLTKLPLGRNNSVMTSLFPPRESLVVTSRLGTGNSRSFFYGVQCH
jgi:hypothetical protein